MPTKNKKNTSTPKDAQHTEQSYLQRLKFDPKMLFGPVAWYLQNIRLSLLLIITIVVLGIFSYLSLPKRLNPEINISIVSVSTVLPGASPEEVEKLLTIPLENEIKGVDGLDMVTSISQNSVSIITAQFNTNVNRDDAKNKVQSAVDTVTDLPEDANAPSVNAFDFENQPVVTSAFSSPTHDIPALMAFIDEMEKKLKDMPEVDRVVAAGKEERELQVIVSPEKVATYGVSPFALMQAVQQATASFPGGVVTAKDYTVSLSVSPTVSDLESLKSLVVRVNGKSVILSDVATIVEGSIPDQSKTLLASTDHDPEQAVTLYVYKRNNTSIDKAGEAIINKIEEEVGKTKGAIRTQTISDTSEEIVEQFSDLLGEFRTTIILVFVCLLLFLGLKQAVISSLTVPLTFLSSFFLMSMVGMSINFLSMFAFLLALGLLVDDTIVVVSAMTTYYKSGKFTPLQTALLVWKDTIIPIWSTTLTTIWSFVPLLLATGIIGEFIKPIPVVVTLTMISSTAIAVLITLPLMSLILKPEWPKRVEWLVKIIIGLVVLGVLWGVAQLFTVPFVAWLVLVVGGGLLWVSGKHMAARVRDMISNNKKVSDWLAAARRPLSRISNHGLINVEPFGHWYQQKMMGILASKSARRKVIAAIIIYAIACFALLPLGAVKGEFFPGTDEDIMYVSISLPTGSTKADVEKTAAELAAKLKSAPELDFMTVEANAGISAFSGGRENAESGVLATIRMHKAEEREKTSSQIAEQLRSELKGQFPGEVSVVELSGGPPAGADVQIALLGDDLGVLQQEANEIMQFLKSQPDFTNTNVSIEPGTSQVVFIPDLAKMNAAGVDTQTVGGLLRVYASGLTLDSLTDSGAEATSKDIVFRFSPNDPGINQLSGMSVPTMSGGSVPLQSLGSFKLQDNPTIITREDNQRTITITAALKAGSSITVPEANQALIDHVNKNPLPTGYTWKTGGANEENEESVTSILRAMGVATLLILVTMVVQFNSFRKAFIVLIVIPIAVSSVFLIFAITGTPLSFPALIGVLSLFGIVVTNSMFIVDKINLNFKEGMPYFQAISDAGSSRLEPIILTKLATVLGLLPITIADPLWRGLGGAIISGLLIASTIMLLFIPALYVEMFPQDKRNVRESK
jgi:multidrug efflux pump subunit AcrB